MLTNIIKATRRHYAALQHRPAADRVAIDYEVTGHTAGTVWVKIDPNNNGQRKREMTRLSNRLQSMFPEARNFSTEYRDAPSKTPMLDGQRYLQSQRSWAKQKPIRNVTLSVQCARCGQIGIGACGCGFQNEKV